MSTRRKLGWEDLRNGLPDTPLHDNILGLTLLSTLMQRLNPAEQRRALAYLNDRYGVVEAESVEQS